MKGLKADDKFPFEEPTEEHAEKVRMSKMKMSKLSRVSPLPPNTTETQPGPYTIHRILVLSGAENL